ncbi:MAG: hypothetical protein ACXADH_18940 [Candidatus Kariarchaeaceae archaeon]|jgi:hypothetical protein
MVFSRQSLARGLTLAANIIAEEIRKITRVGGKGGYPKPISKSITVGTAEVTDDMGRIGVFTEPKGEDNVELTLAFELGSGLFGAGKQKYEIRPIRGEALAFMFPESTNIGPREGVKSVTDESGKAILAKVMHPGIKPNPFLQRAMNQSVDRVLEVLEQNFEYQILDGPKVEVIR